MARTVQILQQWMKQRGLTAKQVSKGSGVPASSLSEILAGKEPSLANAKKLARFFETTIDSLVADEMVQTINFETLEHQPFLDGYFRLRLERVVTKKGKD